jgi:hypothetical protein
MNLTERERRELAELEHALLEEDPSFAGQFGSCGPVLPPARRRGIGIVLRWFGWRRT